MEKNHTNKATPELPFCGTWPDEGLACMDYLHALVPDCELEAACCYEYGRLSRIVGYAAKLRKRLIKSGYLPGIKEGDHEHPYPKILDDNVAIRTDKRFDAPWIGDAPWRALWQCSSFPQLAWNQLGDGERAIICEATGPEKKVGPLQTWDVRTLDAMGVFDQLKEKAHKSRGLLKESIQQSQASFKVEPLLDTKWGVHVLFTLNFQETKKQMVKRFMAWLDLEENSAFGKRTIDPTGTTGGPKDRLKALAVWRLYTKLGFDGMLKFTAANRRSYKERTKVDNVQYRRGDPMPFYDARRGQSSKVPRNQAPLFSEEASARKAKKAAEDYLKEILPFEFGKLAKPPMGKATAAFLTAVKGADF